MEHTQYTVGWIAPLALELVAAKSALDQEYGNVHAHGYSYYGGRIGTHNVVIGVQSRMGTDAASDLAARMQAAFPNIKFFLVVGIGGGVPRYGPAGAISEIVLGDVVVSYPRGNFGGVFRYDSGVWEENEKRKGKGEDEGHLKIVGHTNSPPDELLGAVNNLQTSHATGSGTNIPNLLKKMRLTIHKNDRHKFEDQDPHCDRLFQDSFSHPPDYLAVDCQQCCNLIFSQRRHRRGSGATRETDNPKIHYGNIASSNQLQISAAKRNEIQKVYEAICFEMEGAGVIQRHPCLVIRGVCDYSDSHKNKIWQPYAALTAAAYAKELLESMPAIGFAEDLSITRQNTDFREKLTKIRQWLPAPDPSLNYRKALKQRQTDTGIWLIQSHEYARWKTNNASSLWLYGIPGCGKTILSSTIIQDISQHCSDNPGKAVAYFYFDFNDVQKQNPEIMLRSLICQLLQQCAKTSPGLDALFSSCESRQQLSLDALLEAIQKIVQEFSEAYIILDALDECADRKWLMEVLENIAGRKLQNLHLLVTSRKEREIERSLDSFVAIGLQSELVDGDIQRYVRQKLSDDRDLRKWQKDPAVMEEIETTLMERAHGMYLDPLIEFQDSITDCSRRFRWVVCQLDIIRTCRNKLMLRKSLKTLPPTLDETYDRILSAIGEDDSKYAMRILRWLAFAKRPLLVEEISEIIAIDPERNAEFSSDEVLQDPLEALDICSSLVTIATTEESTHAERDEWSDLSGQVVALAHYSVKEYLISDRIRQGKAAQYSMQDFICNEIIAKSCLQYLLQFQRPDMLSEENIQEFKLAQYSAQFWIDHAQGATQQTETWSPLAMELFSTRKGPYLNWIRIHDPDKPWLGSNFKRVLESTLSPIYYASLVGLTQVVMLLLDKDIDVDVNAKGGTYSNVLHAASTKGHEQIVKLLLHKGANVNTQGGYYSHALQAASAKGHEQIVKLLLNKGASVNAQGRPYGSALQAASSKGYKHIVKLLLDNGADVHAQGGYYGDALQAASYSGHRQIIELLLDRGADVNTQGGLHGNTLQAKSYLGYKHIVKLLRDKRANTDAKGPSKT